MLSCAHPESTLSRTSTAPDASLTPVLLQDWHSSETHLQELLRIIFTSPWSLEKLSFSGKSSLGVSFIPSLCSTPNAKTLKHLWVPFVSVNSDEHFRAIHSLAGLKSLAVRCDGDAAWLGHPALGQLKKLGLFKLPKLLQLPSSLVDLRIDCAKVNHLRRLMRFSDTGSLPALKRLELGCMDLGPIGRNGFHCQLALWLSARPALAFVCCKVRVGHLTEDGCLDGPVWVLSRALETYTAQNMAARFTQGIQQIYLDYQDEPNQPDDLSFLSACPHLKRECLLLHQGVEPLSTLQSLLSVLSLLWLRS